MKINELDDIYVKNLLKIGNGIKNIHVIDNFISSQEVDKLLKICNKEQIFLNKDPMEHEFWHGRKINKSMLNEQEIVFLKKIQEKKLLVAESLFDIDLKSNNLIPEIAVWNPGDFMSRHVDDYDVYAYNVAAILYINDNYTGGEIEFNDYSYNIKPKSGSLVVFPSNKYYMHEVHKVLSGKRYTAMSWFTYKELNIDYNDNRITEEFSDWNTNWEDQYNGKA